MKLDDSNETDGYLVTSALHVSTNSFETRPTLVDPRSLIVWVLGAGRKGCDVALSESLFFLFTSKVKEEEEGEQTETESLVDWRSGNVKRATRLSS